MPYCPNCKYEYRPGIDICPDCDERLVYSLPDEALVDEPDIYSGYADWLPLAKLNSLQYGQMVVEGLKSKNIPAILFSDDGYLGKAGMFGIGTTRFAGGGCLIMVPAQYAGDADKEAELMLGDDWAKSRLGQRHSEASD